MKYLRNLLLSIFACLISSGYVFGQSNLSISNGARIHITENASLTSFNTFIGEESQLNNRGELTILGVLGNNAGTEGLVIKSDENGYGSLLHYTNGVQATVEQYLSSERWHLVSPPIINSTISVYMDIYLKEWQESNGVWQYLSSPVTMPMSSTKGYSCWASDALTGTTTVEYEGLLVGSNLAIPDISYTTASPQTGYNLVGNPYPCAVEWNTNWTLSNVGGWAVVYENGTFKGWNPWMPEGERSYNEKPDGFIAPGQGFWIRAYDENPFVLIPQSARAHTPDIFLKDEAVSTTCNLHLIATVDSIADETTILFMEEGTVEYDGLYELEKHYNVMERPNIYSQWIEDSPQAVLVLPDDWIENSPNAVIPVGFELGTEASCTITTKGLESFNVGQTIFLEDLEKDIMHDLYAGSYEFFSSPIMNTDRFLLHFGYSNTMIQDQSTSPISIYSYGEYAYVKLDVQITGTAQVYDMLGKQICTFSLEDQITKEYIHGTGYFIVTVIAEDTVVTEKIYISN